MRTRLVIVVTCMGLWAAAVAGRLVQLQVVEQGRFAELAARQQQRLEELTPPRGTIYDVRGRRLAVSLDVASAFSDPTLPEFPGVAELVRRVSKALPDRDFSGLAQRFEPGRRFVWVARQLEPEEADRLQAAAIPGLRFETESRRYYPMGSVASHVLGFVGVDHVGLEGLEFLYDQEIRGTPGWRRVVHDGEGRPVERPGALAAQPGADLHLELDAAIQYVVERVLRRTVSDTRAAGGSAVVLDPRTGGVLALASMPDFDPAAFGSARPDHRRNRAVVDRWEPGSTLKMVTATAAIEAGLIDPEDRIDCLNGSITLDRGIRIRDHHPYGLLTFREVIAKSSNVGTIRVGLHVGATRLHDRLVAFGFGRRTGIDLPSESPGFLPSLSAWREPWSTAYISFGQGLASTSLQVANAFAATANGGTLYRPRVVARVVGREGVRERPPEVLGHPLTPATARVVTSLLEGVVAQGGTSTRAAIAGHQVAGKSGTGQQAESGGGYSDRVVASFVGWVPVREPRVVILVAVDNPRGAASEGGYVAAPAFREMASEILAYLGVPASEDELWNPPALAERSLSRVAARVLPIAPGPVPVSAEGDHVPDFVGLSARQAVLGSSRLGLDVRLHGQGFVQRQEPPAGTPLADVGSAVDLWLGEGVLR